MSRLLSQERVYTVVAERPSGEEHPGRDSERTNENSDLHDPEQVHPITVDSGLIIDAGSITRDLLSLREREILPLLCEGLTYLTIASRLSWGESTVRRYSHRICEILGVRPKQLRSKAIELGLIDPVSVPQQQRDLLSPTQHEILPLLCKGLTYAVIAKKLSVDRRVMTERNVATQSYKICQKLGVGDRTGVPSIAIKLGLIDVALVPEQPRDLFSPRQHKVLLLLCHHLDDEAIAERLDVTAGTIRRHLQHICEKLCVDTREQAYSKALELKLFRPDELLASVEYRILLFLCQGYDNGTIEYKVKENRYGKAYDLEGDLDTYLHIIYKKLGVETRKQAHAKTLELGLFKLDELLTPREVEVFSFSCEGLSNRDIGAKLSVSEGTVKTHMEHILRKLMAADRVKACVKAIRLGLIEAASLNPIPWEPVQDLTPREGDVIHLLCAGLSNAVIAKELKEPIGEGTVKAHVEHIIDKVGANDRMQVIVAALAAAKQGLLNLKPYNSMALAAPAP